MNIHHLLLCFGRHSGALDFYLTLLEMVEKKIRESPLEVCVAICSVFDLAQLSLDYLIWSGLGVLTGSLKAHCAIVLSPQTAKTINTINKQMGLIS